MNSSRDFKHNDIPQDEFFDQSSFWNLFAQEYSMNDSATLGGESESISQPVQECLDLVTNDTNNVEPPEAKDHYSEEDIRMLVTIFEETPSVNNFPNPVANGTSPVSDVPNVPVDIS